VTSKSDIRTWNKSSGSGKLFSMDLMDESGEIRATAFKDQCDQYYDYIQVWQITRRVGVSGLNSSIE
jgi:replication factor A1